MSVENKRQKLDPEFKAKWIAALRSGEFQQCTSGDMFKDGKYCCLGVAAELRGYDFKSGRGIGSPYTDVLPYAINGGFQNPIATKLMHFNDDDKKPFSEIADWIEENL